MAHVLPLGVVSLDISNLLTCHQPFLDLKSSDPAARAALLSGAVELLRALVRRAGPGAAAVRKLGGRVVKMMGQLLDEYEQVMLLTGTAQDFSQVS
jgi:hypothetical protein